MNNIPENYYAVILAGGGGTRLWPMSRRKQPKHLLKLIDQQTLLKNTFDNFNQIFPAERIFVITSGSHADLVKSEIPELPVENLIIEPEAKNTALAMGTAAAYAYKRDPKAVIINEAADHLYQDKKKFHETVLAALKVAEKEDSIVAIGIEPLFAHTGLGYIKEGEKVEGLGDLEIGVEVYKGDGFKEKPDLATAKAFLETGKYLWNANLYCWSGETILKAFSKYSPDLKKGLDEILLAIGTDSEQSVLKDVYSKAENIQIDYAVSEKADNLLVIPGNFGWSDIGDWNIVYEALNKDEFGNAIVDTDGNHIKIDTKNCLIEVGGKLVVTIGVEDLVIVDTPDALLICHKDKTQDVKKAVEILKEKKKDQYL